MNPLTNERSGMICPVLQMRLRLSSAASPSYPALFMFKLEIYFRINTHDNFEFKAVSEYSIKQMHGKSAADFGSCSPICRHSDRELDPDRALTSFAW
jgi:hypothetical protein